MEFVEIQIFDADNNQLFQWVIREYDVNAPEWFWVHKYLDEMAAECYASGAVPKFNGGPNLMTMPTLLRQCYSNVSLRKMGDQWWKREFPTLNGGRGPDEYGCWEIGALVNDAYFDMVWWPDED